LANAPIACYKQRNLRPDLMNSRLTLVFPALFASLIAAHSAAEPPLVPAESPHAAPAVESPLVPSASQSPVVLDPAKLRLASHNVVIVDASAHRPVYAKGADDVTPIASLTKLMTAMVTLDARLPLDEPIAIDVDDLDYIKGTKSRLRMGAELPRREMLRLALMSSENRAAASLARTYPGSTVAFVSAMNAKAALLGMSNTRYADPTGLSAQNVSTANDLALLVAAAAEYPQIREFSTTGSHSVEVQSTGQTLGYNNTNNLVKNSHWDIQLSKTGYIREAGKCLVMLATIASKPFVIVLLDSAGKYTRLGDAQRVRHWLETGETLPVASAEKPAHKARKAKKASYQPAATRAAGSRRR
jgi:serine-type D-Ala-D-Ala endopeptidase (penicillin-binding protein 7)